MEPFVESLVRREQVEHARTFVQGLLSDLDHKNVESIAYRLGQERMPLQWFVGVSGWNDEPLREELVRQVDEQLGEEDGVIGTVARWSFGRPLPPGFRGSWAVGWFSAGSRGPPRAANGRARQRALASVWPGHSEISRWRSWI